MTILPALLLALPASASSPVGSSLAGPSVDGPELEVETLTFASQDGLEVTADHYRSGRAGAPLIVLFHQAGWSRGEYREIAPKLCAMGFNCMAIDQRSGNQSPNGVVNETAKRARAKKLGDTYVDARPDILAAIEHARKEYTESKLILWGSSYSSALALQIAGSEPKLVDGVLSFAPGEYFSRFGKPGDWVTTSAKTIACPTFITSAKNEVPQWSAIYDAIPEKTKKTKFVPEGEGQHGSRALWKQFPDHGEYWKAVEGFLGEHFAPKKK